MINLLANENTKIYRRSRTWVLLLVLLAAIVAVAVVKSSSAAPTTHWRPQVVSQVTSLQQALHSSSNLPTITRNTLRQKLLADQYALKHNQNPNLTNGWKFAMTAENLNVLAMAFILVMAGDIVAAEFSGGTIKMLLTQTATRTRILVSKYLATLLFGLAVTAFLFLFSLVVGFIFFGTQGAGVPTFFLNPGGVLAHMSVGAYLLMTYGFFLIEVIVTATIAFMLSTIFRSSALAITVAILTYLVGSGLVEALSKYHWAKYILFANTNLTQYVVGGPTIAGMTLGFSIAVMAIYFVVMLGLAWWIFVRRDVSYS